MRFKTFCIYFEAFLIGPVTFNYLNNVLVFALSASMCSCCWFASLVFLGVIIYIRQIPDGTRCPPSIQNMKCTVLFLFKTFLLTDFSCAVHKL